MVASFGSFPLRSTDMLQSSIQVANWDGNAAHRKNYLKHVRLSVTILGRHALQVLQGCQPNLKCRELAWSVYCSMKATSPSTSFMGPFPAGAAGGSAGNTSYSLPHADIIDSSSPRTSQIPLDPFLPPPAAVATDGNPCGAVEPWSGTTTSRGATHS